MTEQDQQWALFWCHLLHPVIFGEVDARDVNCFLRQLAQDERVFPDGRCKKPSYSTLKRKLKLYRESGFDGLARQPRKDRGRPRVVPPEVIATAVEAKREQPRRSHEAINRILLERHGVGLSRSTYYRHLKQAGATRLKLGIGKQPVRKRWTREHTHDLWLGDFEEGPYVRDGTDTAPTHLCAFIDCHSRYVVDARYYVRQTLDILIDSWARALATHGSPLELYVDNAKVYHSRGLRMACYRFHVRLLHRPPYDAAPGGLVERFFKTAQDQFEAEVRAGDPLALDALNRAFSAWLHVSYHQRINAEIQQTPQARYDEGLTVIRSVALDQVLESFHQRAERTVHRDFADVRLHNRYYRVDPRLRGDKVQVRYDPFSSLDTVQIYSLRDEYLGEGTAHQRETGGGPASPPSPAPKPKHNVLDLLVRQHEKQLNEATRGIDYRHASQPRAWPFGSFVKTFAQLLGRPGGASAFTAGELETLKKTYNRSTGLDEARLKTAFARAEHKTIPYVAQQLHRLSHPPEDS